LAFFFSSRRRHTRFSRDWSSDVCSSDLLNRGHFYLKRGGGLWGELIDLEGKPLWPDGEFQTALPAAMGRALASLNVRGAVGLKRSEERRVGKECSAWSPACDGSGSVGVV